MYAGTKKLQPIRGQKILCENGLRQVIKQRHMRRTILPQYGYECF